MKKYTKMKKSIKERLEKKSIKELKVIYIRLNGIDLLRGSKAEMINTLYSNLTARSNWQIISRS